MDSASYQIDKRQGREFVQARQRRPAYLLRLKLERISQLPATSRER